MGKKIDETTKIQAAHNEINKLEKERQEKVDAIDADYREKIFELAKNFISKRLHIIGIVNEFGGEYYEHKCEAIIQVRDVEKTSYPFLFNITSTRGESFRVRVVAAVYGTDDCVEDRVILT